MTKYTNGYFARHIDPKVVNLQAALRSAREEGSREGKVVADYLWDEDLLALQVTFSDDEEDKI